MFEWYHIVAASDLTEAAARLDGVTGREWQSGGKVATVQAISAGRKRRDS